MNRSFVRCCGRIDGGRARLRLVTAILVAGCLVAGHTLYAGDAVDAKYDRVDTQVMTPHISWCTGISAGNPKLLVIGPAWGLREAVELEQRFGLHARVIMTRISGSLVGRMYGTPQPFSPARVAERFDMELAAKPDVIVIGGVSWKQILIEHRYEILRLVHDEGKGLVYVSPPRKDPELAQLFGKKPLEENPEITNGIPWEILTAYNQRKPNEVVRSGSFGKGRWVRLDYRVQSTNHCLTPVLTDPGTDWEYEYAQSLVAKAVLWAGRRASAVRLTSAMPTGITVTGLPASLVMDFANPGGAQVVRARVFLHSRATNRLAASKEFVLKPGGQRLTLKMPVPRTPAGGYVCSAMLLGRDGRAIVWASRALTIASDLLPIAITPDREVFGAGRRITGTVRINRKLRPGEIARVAIVDNHGRLLRRMEFAALPEQIFGFAGIQPLGTNAHVLRVEVVNNNIVLARSERAISIKGRRVPAFHHAVWQEPEIDCVSRKWLAHYQEVGVDTIYRRTRDKIKEDQHFARLLAKANLFGAPEYPAFHTRTRKSPIGPVHTNPLFDPALRQRQIDKVNKTMRAYAPVDVLFYCEGSDTVMHGVDFSAYTLRAFRQAMQDRYEKIDVLNREWGTAFKAWDEVVPPTLAACRKSGNFIPWILHQRFMETIYNENRHMLRGLIEAGDPGTPMGPDGYGRLNVNDGADWWQIMGKVSFVNLYRYQDPPQMEIVRSLARHFPQVKLRSLYYGSYTGEFGDYALMRQIPWFSILHDYNGLFWWTATGKTGYNGCASQMLNPDMTNTRTFDLVRREITAVRKGPARMLQASERMNLGIGIYYSQLAVHAAAAYSHPSFLVRSSASYQKILEDLGCQYDYVAEAQIDNGMLEQGKFRLLLLPYTLAMKPKTAEAIRRFVMRGGVVLANTASALYDDLLRPAANGSLFADMFGKHGEFKSVGKGGTFLTASLGAGYSGERSQSKKHAMRRIFADITRKAGARPFMALDPENMDDHADVEIVSYRAGAGYFIGILNNRDQPLAATARLPEKYHVYDVRTHSYHGQVDAWQVKMRPGTASLYACLPYAVDGVVAKSVYARVRMGGGWRCEFTVKRNPADARSIPHAICIQVLQPDGRQRPEYAQVVIADRKGKAGVSIPFALNDPTGTWKIRASDAVSGKSVTAEVVLLK